MSTINYGRIAITLRKDFTPGDEAIPLDAVFYDGSLWACIKRTSDLPAESSDGWMLAAQGVKLGGDNGVVVGPDGKITIQIQPGGGLGVDSNGQLYVDRSVFQALIQAGQGIDVAGDGTVSAKVQTGGGIEFDGNGQMFVNPNTFPAHNHDDAYVANSRKILTAAPLTGGGALSDDLSLSITPGPDGSMLMSLDGNLIWQQGKIPHILPDGEFNLYVRTDGNDSNDGIKNEPERAFASLEQACKWVNEREFYGKGFISIRIADGNYQQSGNGYSFTAKCYDPSPFWFAPDLYQPISRETHRIRVIGNVASPANVLITLDNTQTGNALAGAHFYGLSFHHNGPAIFKDNLGSILSATVTNCRFVVGAAAKSPFANVLRCTGSGGDLTGSIQMIFEAPKQCSQLIAVMNGAYHIGGYSHNTNGNACNINGNITVPGPVTVNSTVSVSSNLVVIPGYSTASSFTGTGITGARYSVYYPGCISTGGYGVNFFPGTAAGSAIMPTSTIS